MCYVYATTDRGQTPRHRGALLLVKLPVTIVPVIVSVTTMLQGQQTSLGIPNSHDTARARRLMLLVIIIIIIIIH